MQVVFIIFSNLFIFILKHTEKYIDEFFRSCFSRLILFFKIVVKPSIY